MIEINSKRLKLVPLNEHNLQLAIDDFNKLEETLGVQITENNIGVREKDVYKIRLKNVIENPSQYEWYTPWLLISKEENRIIGAIMIKNYPDSKGEVIIGYAMQEGFRRKGYMFEAVENLIEWMFENEDVKSIIADTLKENEPSHLFLEKLGMQIYKEDNECNWWRLDKQF